MTGRWIRRVTKAMLVIGLVGWWFTLGPVPLGGPATFAVVDGISMEPTLQGGDLVVARAQPSYQRGDLIVFPVADGRVVIHRIVGGSAEAGWTTQGDNNDMQDAWRVPADDVLGRYWFELADVGRALLWSRSHPLLFGAGVASVVAVIGLLGRVRPRRHRDLLAAMARGRRASRLAGRPAAEIIAFGAAGLATATMTVTLAMLVASGLSRTWAALLASVVLLVAAGTFVFLTKRLADGWRLPEPLASQYALSARCWDVSDLPHMDRTVVYDSTLDFRRHAERRRLPVLRHRGPETITYLTISHDGLAHRRTITAAIGLEQSVVNRPESGRPNCRESAVS